MNQQDPGLVAGSRQDVPALPLSEVLHVVKQDLFAFLESHFNLVGRPGEFDRAQSKLGMIDHVAG